MRRPAWRESDLEALAARRAALADDAALATVTVVLQTPALAESPPEPEADGFLAGLDAGWSALPAAPWSCSRSWAPCCRSRSSPPWSASRC